MGSVNFVLCTGCVEALPRELEQYLPTAEKIRAKLAAKKIEHKAQNGIRGDVRTEIIKLAADGYLKLQRWATPQKKGPSILLWAQDAIIGIVFIPINGFTIFCRTTRPMRMIVKPNAEEIERTGGQYWKDALRHRKEEFREKRAKLVAESVRIPDLKVPMADPRCVEKVATWIKEEA